MIGDVHHVGYLVKKIDKSIQAFEMLGYMAETQVYYDKDRWCKFCFMKKKDIRVELVETCEKSDIYPLLKKYNNSIYHICYKVDNIDTTVDALKKQGFLLFLGKQKATAISSNSYVAFLMHASIGIIELLQEDF